MRCFVFSLGRRHAAAFGITIAALSWPGLAATPASPHPRGDLCATVPAAEHTAQTRLEAFFAAVTEHEPARARRQLGLHRRNPAAFRTTFVLAHSKLHENRVHIEISYRAHAGPDRSFDRWVRARDRRFTVLVVNGDYVRDRRIGLAVNADMVIGGHVRHYGGKAEFDCVLNRYVFLALGRRI